MKNPLANLVRIGGILCLAFLLLSCLEPVYRPAESKLSISSVPWQKACLPGESRQSYWRRLASSADGVNLAAVDSGGHIHTSSDAGQTWIERTAAGSGNWTSIAASADGSRLAASRSGGYVLTSSDSGETWVPRVGSGSRSWSQLACSTDGLRLAAATRYDFIYTSSDGGGSWIRRTTAGSRDWSAVASSADGLRLAACAGGSTFISTNGGDTWAESSTGQSQELRAIASSSNGVFLAAGTQDGRLFLSGNGGVSWSECFGAGSFNTYDVCCSPDGNEIAVANGSSVHVSLNHGETWTEHTPGTTAVTALARSADGAGLVAAAKYLYTSVDGGTNWNEHRDVGRRRLCAIVGSSDLKTLSVADYGGYLYRSADGGESWEELEEAGTKDWVALASSSDGLQLAASHCELDPAVSMSPDGGETWIYRTAIDQVTWLASSADGRKLAMIDVSGMVRTSDDWGENWISRGALEPGAGSHEPAIALSANSNLLLAVFSNDYYVSADGGLSWAVHHLGLLQTGYYSMAISADASRAAVSCLGHVFTSMDAGETWRRHDEVGWEDWQAIAMSADGRTIAVAPAGGLIFISNDGGETWVAHEGAGVREWRAIACSSEGTSFVAVAEVERNGVYLFP